MAVEGAKDSLVEAEIQRSWCYTLTAATSSHSSSKIEGSQRRKRRYYQDQTTRCSSKSSISIRNSNSNRGLHSTSTRTRQRVYYYFPYVTAAATTLVGAVLLRYFPSCGVSALAFEHSNTPSVTLWDTISGDPDYSKLTACLKMADPIVSEALRGSDLRPLTLFAPRDFAFEQPDWSWNTGLDSSAAGIAMEMGKSKSIFNSRCRDEGSATALMSYHVSTTTSSTPYIGEEFHTLLGDDYSAHFYGIFKSADVPASSFPIQFVDAANVTAAPLAVGGTSYLFPVDRVLRPPVGTIWETLLSDPSFSLLTAALNSTDLARSLDADGGGAASSYTLFAPDNEAIEASSDFPQDPAALEILLSFHTLGAGAYPLSLNGAHFLQQLFRVDPAGGSLARDYYRDFYASSFEEGQVTSLAGPLLNITRSPSLTTATSCLSPRWRQLLEEDTNRHNKKTIDSSPPPSSDTNSKTEGPLVNLEGNVRAYHSESSSVLIEGVPISEADMTATNGVIHRLSAAVMAPPATTLGVLLSSPFPLSVAGGAEGGGFEALGELVRLAGPLVNETLEREGPLTVLAPTDAAFDMAIAAGDLPPRPWNDSSSSSSPIPFQLTPQRAARLLLSHTLRTPEGPLLFSPTAADPFASGFTNGDRFSTVVSVSQGGFPKSKATAAEHEMSRNPGVETEDQNTSSMGRGRAVEVGVRVLEVGTRSTTTGTADVPDKEVYVDGARVFQCVDGAGFGHDCGSKPRPSNTYALNGAHLCVVHAVDRVIFPADPETDLAVLIDNTPSLSRFSALLKDHGLSPTAADSNGNDHFVTPKTNQKMFTVFAPTNEALNRLEKLRPWLFNQSLSYPSTLTAAEPSDGDGVDDERNREVNQGWSPVRELLAYHLIPGDALFSRYFNSSSRKTPTLALNGRAPVDASFMFANESLAVTELNWSKTKHRGQQQQQQQRGDKAYSYFMEPPSGAGAKARRTLLTERGGTLHVNLQTCSSTDASASNGVLHVLEFLGEEGDEFGVADVGRLAHHGIRDFSDSGRLGDGAGVLVPDVLELTYAFGFRKTYAAIIAGDTNTADEKENGAENISSTKKTVMEDILTEGSTMADVLRGSTAHTLLAVEDSGMSESSCFDEAQKGVLERNCGLSMDTLRYQTLVGDQTLLFPGMPSLKLKTLFGPDAHAFNNSENPVNPFLPTNGSGLHVDQAQVISLDSNMVALNGRIHEISEHLRAPASDIFSLLSSHSELSGWAAWVQLTGLADLLADPKAGPFTVFAPVDGALEMVPARISIADDTENLANLVAFHVVTGTVQSSPSVAVGSGGSGFLRYHPGNVGDIEKNEDSSSFDVRGEGGVRLFTPSLANATAEERSALSGERFASGRSLRTLFRDDMANLCVQVAAAAIGTGNGDESIGDRFRVFVGPGQQQTRENTASVGKLSGVEGLGNLYLGAFAAEIVLPDLNAVNGVVHGINGVITYPGYKRPPAVVGTKR